MEEMRRSGGRRGEKRREKWWAQNCRSCSHRRLAWPEAEHPKASRARAGWASSGTRIPRAEPRGRGRPRLLPCLAGLDVQNDKGEPGALLESKSLGEQPAWTCCPLKPRGLVGRAQARSWRSGLASCWPLRSPSLHTRTSRSLPETPFPKDYCVRLWG